MERVAQWLDAVVETCGRITAWSSLAIVLVMAGNVLLRYVFNTGSVAMQELEWHLMAPIALLSMAYAIKHDGHVRVDVAYARFPRGCSRESRCCPSCWWRPSRCWLCISRSLMCSSLT